MAQSLATQAAPLFEDDTDLEIVPDGTVYLKDDAELTAALIRRKGNKLYVDGRLTLTAESAALLPQLEYCKVTGTAWCPPHRRKHFPPAVCRQRRFRPCAADCCKARAGYRWTIGCWRPRTAFA